MRGRNGVSALLFVFLLFAADRVSAQSAELVAAVSDSTVLQLGEAAALVGIVGGSLPAQADPATAAEKLRTIGFSVPARPAGSPITIGEYCYLVVQLLDLPHGLLYTMLPGPRYAIREMQSRGIVAEGTHPGSRLSGNEALRILGMALRAGELR